MCQWSNITLTYAKEYTPPASTVAKRERMHCKPTFQIKTPNDIIQETTKKNYNPKDKGFRNTSVLIYHSIN
jgi:hypothetical protein